MSVHKSTIIDKEALFGKTLSQLTDIVAAMKMPGYTARQLANWLYVRKVDRFDQMTDISKAFREKLDKAFVMGVSDPVEVQISTDGTKKYLFKTGGGGYIESAFIPEAKRFTLCVSTQLGCRMGCLFCMTGRQGLSSQLSPGEILNQVRSLPESSSLTNIVYMGMGEPFDNTEAVMDSLEILTSAYGLGMSPKRITVSTIGIIPGMIAFLSRSRCHLAVSLHSPFEEERRKLMPVGNKYPLGKVMEVIRSFPLEKQRRVSFEYIVFKGINHSQQHVNEMARILNGIRCRVNLLTYHPIPGSDLESPANDVISGFQKELEKKGIITTIRKSRGQDIFAACGLLSTATKTKKAV